MATRDSLSSSAPTYTAETTDTPTSRGSRSQEYPDVLDAPSSDGIDYLPDSSNKSDTTLNSLQSIIESMQHDLQVQLEKRQRDFEVRIKSLLIAQGKAGQPTVSDSSEIESSTFDASSSQKDQHLPINTNTGKPDDESRQYMLEQHGPPNRHRSPCFQSYSKPFHAQDQSLRSSASRIKASDLPKFSGHKEEDAEIWIEQISAIFHANNSSTSEIVALLSVILKNRSLQWFTRLGSKGRARLSTWTLWRDALRQRFLKANYLLEKKRLWKQRDSYPTKTWSTTSTRR
jgi:hypothetical protein